MCEVIVIFCVIVMDFFWDCYIFKSAMVGRLLAYVTIFLSSIVSYLSNKMIVIIRGVDTRHSVLEKSLKFLKPDGLNVLFYPESTRLNHLHVSETYHYLKPGLLKSIWEYSNTQKKNRNQDCSYNQSKLKIQICISSNKENVINEKKFFVNNNIYKFFNYREPVLVKYYIDKEIYPEDFSCFNDFYEHVISRWCVSWNKIYSS